MTTEKEIQDYVREIREEGKQSNRKRLLCCLVGKCDICGVRFSKADSWKCRIFMTLLVLEKEVDFLEVK